MLKMMEENLERSFAADPYRQMGGFVKRCLGVNIYAKIENPAGHRIERFFAEGALLATDNDKPQAVAPDKMMVSLGVFRLYSQSGLHKRKFFWKETK